MSAPSGLSAYLENKILLWLSGTTFPAAPTNLFLAFFSTNPTDGGATVAGIETDYGSYARTSVAAATLFSAAPTGIPKTLTNVGTVAGPTCATTPSTFPVTGWGLYDAITAGNLLVSGAIGTPFQVIVGQTPTFAAGALVGSVQ
jgi:hypothetical protein